MPEACEKCGSQKTFIEYLDENQTGKGCFKTRIIHCRSCGSNPNKLV